jgi:hypothetical protein
VLHASLNYPHGKVSLHGNTACGSIGKGQKARQRRITLSPGTLETELARFESGEHKFGSHAGANDMWVTVDLATPDSDEEAVRRIHQSLASRHKPFQNAVMERHC